MISDTYNFDDLSQSIQSDQQSGGKSPFVFRNFIPPPNPITTKKTNKQDQNNIDYLRTRSLFRPIKLTQGYLDEEISLINFYNEESLIFQKYKNQGRNQRNGIKYAASIFIEEAHSLEDKMQYIGMVKTDNLIQFDSSYESANLFKVYKTGLQEYDLILQNDVNTTGYCQWFNFKVSNKANNIRIKFNIVNMYKSGSLYQKGMKPFTISKFSEKDQWQRNAFQIKYYENQIPTQRNTNKNYYTLSFCYNFYRQNDEVQFCHFFPYSLKECDEFLSKIRHNNKVEIKVIGKTFLQKPIQIVYVASSFSLSDSKKRKKAIIMIGRQHPGQIQSSFLVENIVNQLISTKNTEIDFLLQKFDFYICPMLNIDGIILGNYRTNFNGYDLNRYWHHDEQLKTPEIFYFKRFIQKIKKRQKISLILDLHGHSKKLNSFFYGNPLGKNYMMLPYVASKICNMINFKSCCFKQQKSSKSNAARAFLGDMLKNQSYVYTFEVSFWGHKQNNFTVPFKYQSFKYLSEGLIQAIYKVFLEEFKQEISLKESIFLKEINVQLDHINQQSFFEEQSGSDSEAKDLTIKQNYQKALIKDKKSKQVKTQQNIKENYSERKQIGVQTNVYIQKNEQLNHPKNYFQNLKENAQKLIFQRQFNEVKTETFYFSKSLKKKKNITSFQSSSKNKQNSKLNQSFYHFSADKNKSFQGRRTFFNNSTKNISLPSTDLKQFLLDKLKICGQNLNESFFQKKQYIKSPKIKQSKFKNASVQVPQKINSGQNKKKKQLMDESRNNPLESHTNLSRQDGLYKNTDKKNNFRTKIKSNKYFQIKRKSFSLNLHKQNQSEIPITNEASLEKIVQKKQFSFNLPFVKIGKIQNLNKQIGSQIKKREKTFQNINFLKGKITALKRQSRKKLPDSNINEDFT